MTATCGEILNRIGSYSQPIGRKATIETILAVDGEEDIEEKAVS